MSTLKNKEKLYFTLPADTTDPTYVALPGVESYSDVLVQVISTNAFDVTAKLYGSLDGVHYSTIPSSVYSGDLTLNNTSGIITFKPGVFGMRTKLLFTPSQKTTADIAIIVSMACSGTHFDRAYQA